LVIGADYDWQQSPITGNPASSEVTGWASFRMTKGLNLSLFGSTGLNNNSTDFAGGMTISVLFGAVSLMVTCLRWTQKPQSGLELIP
jgi:hypothetical protein